MNSVARKLHSDKSENKLVVISIETRNFDIPYRFPAQEGSFWKKKEKEKSKIIIESKIAIDRLYNRLHWPSGQQSESPSAKSRYSASPIYRVSTAITTQVQCKSPWNVPSFLVSVNINGRGAWALSSNKAGLLQSIEFLMAVAVLIKDSFLQCLLPLREILDFGFLFVLFWLHLQFTQLSAVYLFKINPSELNGRRTMCSGQARRGKMM